MKLEVYYWLYIGLLKIYDRLADVLYWLEIRLYEPDEAEDETETLGGSNTVHIPRVGKGLH